VRKGILKNRKFGMFVMAIKRQTPKTLNFDLGTRVAYLNISDSVAGKRKH
jgi:hypothetical protein